MRNCFRAAAFPGSSRLIFAARSTSTDQPLHAACSRFAARDQQLRCDVRQSGCISSLCRPKNYTQRSLSEISEITRGPYAHRHDAPLKPQRVILRDLVCMFVRTRVQLPSGSRRQNQPGSVASMQRSAPGAAPQHRSRVGRSPCLTGPGGPQGAIFNSLEDGHGLGADPRRCDRSMSHARHELS